MTDVLDDRAQAREIYDLIGARRREYGAEFDRLRAETAEAHQLTADARADVEVLASELRDTQARLHEAIRYVESLEFEAARHGLIRNRLVRLARRFGRKGFAR